MKYMECWDGGRSTQSFSQETIKLEQLRLLIQFWLSPFDEVKDDVQKCKDDLN